MKHYKQFCRKKVPRIAEIWRIFGSPDSKGKSALGGSFFTAETQGAGV
jgi:hypothetical protein